MTGMTDLDPTVFQPLGLSSYGARAYVALATRGPGTAHEVAAEAGLPRQRVYDVLEALADQGLVARTSGGRAYRYQALDPEQAVALLVGTCRERLTEHAETAGKTAARLRTSWLATKDTPAPQRSEGGVTVAGLGQWQHLATRQVLATNRPPFDRAPEPSWLTRVEHLTRAGGTVRCIYHSDILTTPTQLAHAHRYAEAGEQARTTEHVEARMILTDGRTALLRLSAIHPQEPHDRGALRIDQRDAVAHLETEFEKQWASAIPLPQPYRRQ
jgi:predicted transcriptional regulator